MKPKLLFSINAIYLALSGLVMLLMPQVMIFSGTAGTPPGVFFALRSYGGLLLGFAVINWMARNADPSKLRDGIFVGNYVAYGLAFLVFLYDLVTGGAALVWAYVIICALFTAAFFWVGGTNRSSVAK
jgi:hypothetical protein